MNKQHLKIYLALAVLILAALACDFSFTTANFADAQMARDPEGSDPTTVFSPNDTFYCVVDLDNAPDDTTVSAVWTAVDVEGTEPNTRIDEVELTTGTGTLHFELSNTNPWPEGQYKVDLYINDELAQTLEFEVQAQ